MESFQWKFVAENNVEPICRLFFSCMQTSEQSLPYFKRFVEYFSKTIHSDEKVATNNIPQNVCSWFHSFSAYFIILPTKLLFETHFEGRKLSLHWHVTISHCDMASWQRMSHTLRPNSKFHSIVEMNFVLLNVWSISLSVVLLNVNLLTVSFSHFSPTLLASNNISTKKKEMWMKK